MSQILYRLGRYRQIVEDMWTLWSHFLFTVTLDVSSFAENNRKIERASRLRPQGKGIVFIGPRYTNIKAVSLKLLHEFFFI